MNKGYQYNPTLTEIFWAIIKLIRDLLSLLSPRLAERFYAFCSKHLTKEETKGRGVLRYAPTVKEEAKMITLPEEHGQTSLSVPPTSVPAPGIDLSATKRQVETQPYIDRGPLLPEHYGDDRIVALVRDPHCIFVYWDLNGFKSQELLNYHKGPKYWSLRVHHFGEEAYHDMSINADARNWYLWVDDNKGYVIDLGFFTQHGEFVTLASSNPVQSPRAGTSQEYAEYWGFIFREVKKVTPEGVVWVSPGGRWYEGWIEAHIPGSPILQTQKKGQGK
ncbi:MAG TPA: DUF4912 domain-containing protein [Candidatus Brocadiales bacterium]|nr:DUF4912 domain-containing protein [Candidatus Brocadiales bacterium]